MLLLLLLYYYYYYYLLLLFLLFLFFIIIIILLLILLLLSCATNGLMRYNRIINPCGGRFSHLYNRYFNLLQYTNTITSAHDYI